MSKIQPVGTVLAGMGAVGMMAIHSVVSEAAAFNAQAALMKVAAGDAAVGFDALHDAAIRVGGDTQLVGVSASGAADSITNLYKAGLKTTDIFGDLSDYMEEGAELGGVLRASIDLAAASEMGMARASDVVSIAMATFGRKSSDASDIANNFVQSADASVASVSELAAAMVNVGPTAAAFNWSLEDVNTALAVLSQRGIRGAEAGTALKSMMTNLMRPTDKVKEALKELNVGLYDQTGHMRELPDILSQFESGLAGITEEQRNQYIQTLAGTYGMKAMNTLLAEGVVGWSNMEQAIAGASTAQEVGAAKADTYMGKMEAFEGAIESAKISLGEAYLPALTGAISKGTELTESFNNLSPAAKRATATIGAVSTAVAAAAGGFILIGPRIVSIVSAFKALAAMTGVSALLSEMAVGFQLVAGGASIAGTASLGLGAALGAIAAPAAAAVASVLAIKKIVEFSGEVQEHHADATDAMSDALRRWAGEGKSATAIADKYRGAQQRVQAVIEQAPWYTKPFIDAQKLSAASTGDLSDILAGSADSYREYAGAMRVAGQETAAISQIQFDAVKAIDRLDEGYRRDIAAMGEVYTATGEIAAAQEHSARAWDAYGMRLTAAAAASTMAAAASDQAASSHNWLAEAANMAALAEDGLAEAAGNAAGKMAEAFGAADFGNKALWEMALASGATIQQLEELALQLGIATEADIQATLGQAALMGQYAATGMSAEDLIMKNQQLALSQQVLISDAGLLAGAQLQAAANTNALAASIEASDSKFRQVSGSAQQIKADIEAIPSHKDIRITIHTNVREAAAAIRAVSAGGHLQHGTSHWKGGLARVGETGPEMVSLPRGSRVWNSQQTRGMTSSGGTWTGNIIINGASNPQSSAAAVIRALEDRGMLSKTALR